MANDVRLNGLHKQNNISYNQSSRKAQPSIALTNHVSAMIQSPCRCHDPTKCELNGKLEALEQNTSGQLLKYDSNQVKVDIHEPEEFGAEDKKIFRIRNLENIILPDRNFDSIENSDLSDVSHYSGLNAIGDSDYGLSIFTNATQLRLDRSPIMPRAVKEHQNKTNIERATKNTPNAMFHLDSVQTVPNCTSEEDIWLKRLSFIKEDDSCMKSMKFTDITALRETVLGQPDDIAQISSPSVEPSSLEPDEGYEASSSNTSIPSTNVKLKHPNVSTENTNQIHISIAQYQVRKNAKTCADNGSVNKDHNFLLSNAFISDFFSERNENNNVPLGNRGNHSTQPELRNEAPAIEYIDVWPQRMIKRHLVCDCSFETFEVLVERANKWLRRYPQYELITCETVSKKVLLAREICSLNMHYSDPEGPTPAAVIMGLRLWYRQFTDPYVLHMVQALRYVDVQPVCFHAHRKRPKYEGCAQTLKRINQRLMEEPLSGTIFSMETIQLKIPQEDWRSPMVIEPNATMWYDEYNVHVYSFIRLFYRHSQHVVQQLGFQDFWPDTIDEGSLFHPAKYSSFSTLLKKATNWINKATDKTVLNIQTLHVKHRRKLENKGHRFKTDAMFERKIECRFRAFFIRVSFALKPSADGNHLVMLRQPRLTCRTYLPWRLQNGLEHLDDIVKRINSDITEINSQVFQVETIAIPEWMTDPSISECGDRTFFDGEWYFVPDQDGNDKGPYRYALLYAIRVYFDCPPLYTELQHRISAYKLHNACCNIL